MEKNEKVDWKVFLLVISIAGTIFGVLWKQINDTNYKIDKVQSSVTEVKVDLTEVKSDMNNLVKRIDKGEITFFKTR